jgi:alkanesulfonate monooxygenase SsuD/methylene tetrahydromethanopterin reductase-like flavin-dependent oxidoreductase (luciferase family)
MPVEFSTNATLSAAHPSDSVEEIERLVNVLHPRFTTLWFSDHPQHTTLEAWTSATFVAARYPRFKVGTLVLAQSYRNPGLLAKMAASLQTLSGGRLILGLGAGWHEEDYRAYHYEFPRPGVRVAQLAETLELLCTMWTTNPATYHGAYYHVEAAISAPLPDPMIPILVGTTGKRAMQIATRLADIWSWDMCDNFPELLSALRRSCVEYGRSPGDMQVYVEAQVSFPKDPATFVPYYDSPVPSFGRSNHLGPTPQAAIEQIKPYRDLGIEHFIVSGDLDSMRRFSAEVVPAVE